MLGHAPARGLAGAPEAVRPAILEAASDAFLHGMAAGCRVAALATFAGAVVAFVALPARAAEPVDAPGTRPDPDLRGELVEAGPAV